MREAPSKSILSRASPPNSVRMPVGGLRRAIELNEHALTLHPLARIRGKEVLASAKMCVGVDRDGTREEHEAGLH